MDENCTRCRTNRRPALPYMVSAFAGDSQPVRAILCFPCLAQVKAGKAIAEDDDAERIAIRIEQLYMRIETDHAIATGRSLGL